MSFVQIESHVRYIKTSAPVEVSMNEEHVQFHTRTKFLLDKQLQGA